MKRWLVLVALLGCGKNAAECKLEAQELTKFLRDSRGTPTSLFAEPGITLAKRDLAISKLQYGPVVFVTADSIKYAGTPYTDPAELGKTVFDRVPMRERAKSPPIYFQIDKGTPWSKVVALVDGALAAGFTTYGFAFSTGRKKPAPPPRSSVDDKLDKVLVGADMSGNQAVELANTMKDVIAGCTALEKSFAAVGSEEGDKAETLIVGIEEGLIDCNCKIDVPALRSVMWRILVTDPDIQAITYTGRGGDKVAFPGSATWGEVGPKLPKTATATLVAD